MKYIKRYEQFTNDELSKESFKSWLVGAGLGLSTLFGPSKATATDSGAEHTAIMTPEIDNKMDTDVKVSKISTATELKITDLLKKDVKANLKSWTEEAKNNARSGMSPAAYKAINLVINIDGLIDRIGIKVEKSFTNQIPIVVKAIKNGDTKKSCITYSETLKSDLQKIINEEIESLNWAQKTAIRTTSKKIIPENEFCVGLNFRKNNILRFIAIASFSHELLDEEVQFSTYESGASDLFHRGEIDQSFFTNFYQWRENMLNHIDANGDKTMIDIVNFAGKILYGNDYTFQGKIENGEVKMKETGIKLKKLNKRINEN